MEEMLHPMLTIWMALWIPLPYLEIRDAAIDSIILHFEIVALTTFIAFNNQNLAPNVAILAQSQISDLENGKD